MNLLNIKQTVEKLLAKSQECRENDNRLIVSIWAAEIGHDKIDTMTATDILNKISNNELTSPESIRRVRQKLQEKNPLYRGRNYLTRNKEQEQVKEQLKQF